MTINPMLRAQQAALNSAPSYRRFIQINENPDGTLSYLNLATNQSHETISEAFSSVESLGLVDYRLFSPRVGGRVFENFSSTQGANQLESEILVINRFLREASTDPTKMQALRNVELDHLVGQEINGRMYKFNTRGQRDIVNLVSSQFPTETVATASLTDEGYTLMQYVRADGSQITGRQAKMLQSIVGVGPIQEGFVKKLLETDDYTNISKLAKRLQSTMSPRNVSLGEQFMETFLETSITPFENRTMSFDGIAGQLEIMLRDRGIEGAGIRQSEGLSLAAGDVPYGERILGFSTTPGYKLTPTEKLFLDAGALEDDLSQRSGLSMSEKIDQRLTLRRQKLLTQMTETYGFSEVEIDRVAQLWEQATTTAMSDTSPGNMSEKIFKEFKKLVNNVFDDRDGSLSAHNRPFLPLRDHMNRKFQNKVGAMINGLEKSRDGQFIVTPTLLRDIKTAYEGQIESMITGSGVLSREQTQDLLALQKQVESINKALQKTGKGDIIARINLGIGQIKGEAFVVSDRIAENFARDSATGLAPYIITDVTNIKPEVGSRLARNILFDIGEDRPGAFTDPLMFLYHGEYFSQPSFVASLQQNAMAKIHQTTSFMETGIVPEEVMRSLQADASDQIGGKNLANRLKIDIGRLDPVTRASHVRRKQEADEILRLMASGSDPRQIPQMVRRINDFFNASVVRYKNGRADVVMPTAERFSLRTLESKLVEGEGFFATRSFGVDLSMYGHSGGTLNFSNFRIKGKSLLMAGEAAYKYQHSLGGFDLDDKGIPIMSTFIDSSNKKRLAFMTLRQPTSFQESLAMTADLTDSETVRQLFKNNDRFISALGDETLLSSLGIDSSSTQFRNLTRMVTQDNIKLSDVDYDAVENMIIKISESSAVFTQGLPSLTQSSITRMAMSQSPSLIGLDKMTSAGSPLSTFMLDLGLDPSKTPAPYDSDVIFQIFRKQSEASFNEELLGKISQELGFDVTKEEAIEFLNKTGARYSPGMEHKISAIAKEFITKIMEDTATTSVEESIGLFINRQSTAVNVLESSRSILESEFGIRSGDTLFGEFQKVASFATIPASEAVDFSKQIALEQVLTNFGSALSRINAELGISEEIVEKTLRAYMTSVGNYTEEEMGEALNLLQLGKTQLKLDPLGQQALRSHAGVGFVRAKQIAEQISTTGSVIREELYGLQQTLYDDTLGYARVMRTDQSIAAKEVLQGMEAYLSGSEGTTLSPEQQEAIRQEISTIRASGTAAEQVQSLFMQTGTTAYERYAKHDQLVRAITDINTAAEISKRESIAESRRLAIKTDPVIKSEYRTQSKNIVDDISSELISIDKKAKELLTTGGQADAEVFNIRTQRVLALRKIYERISAVKSAEISAGRTFDGSSALDLVDSIEGQMSSLVGAQEARKILTSETITESDDDITFMMELFKQARSRRIAQASKGRVDLHAVAAVKQNYDRSIALKSMANRTLADAGLPSLPSDIADITGDQAQHVIDAARYARRRLSITDAEKSDMQVLSELMARIKGTGTMSGYEGASEEAAAAYQYYFQGTGAIKRAEEEAGRLASTGLLSPAEIPAAATDAVTQSAGSASSPTATQTTYRRFTDSLRRGALGDALKNKIVKRGLIGAAALSGFGFIYSARKDHSASDVTGPPLMPGGNPYEEGYPQQNLSIQENLNIANPSTRGMQYKIYTSGSSEDTERLSSMLNGVVDGPISSTMYNSLPRLGQDPYSQVASSF